MSFSFCLNKNELLFLAGFGLLFQGLNLDRKGKLIQDSQRLLCSVIEILERNGAPGATEFKKVACAMISVDRFTKGGRAQDDPGSCRKSDGVMPAPPKTISKSARKFQAIASRFSNGITPTVKQETSNRRRSTAPNLSAGEPLYARSDSQNSISSAVSDPLTAQYSKRMDFPHSPHPIGAAKPPNLDYLSFNDPTPSPQHASPASSKRFHKHDRTDSANLGLSVEAQPPLDSLFPSPDVFSSYISPSPSANVDWCSDMWNVPSEYDNQPPQSHVSFSEEEITSGEELSSCDLGGDFRAMTIPVEGLASLEGVDGGFGL